MLSSGADLHVGEVLRRACRLLHYDRCSPLSGCPVAELAIRVVSPGVGVSVAAYSQGKTSVIVFSAAGLVEFDAVGVGWRSDGGFLSAQLAALVGVDAPRVAGAFACPVGGEGEVVGDRFAEVVGDFTDEPSVELVAFARRIGRRPLDPAVWVGDILVPGFGVSSVCLEADCVAGFCVRISCQWLVDGVTEASGEGVAVLSAGDKDGG